MSNPRIEMLERRVDRIEQRMEDWDKLLHGMETTVTLILKDQQVMKKNIAKLEEGQARLEEGLDQLAVGQMQLFTTTSEIKDQQAQMMAILLQLIDRIP